MRHFQAPSVNVNLEHQKAVLYILFQCTSIYCKQNSIIYTHRSSWMGGTVSGHHKSVLGVSLNHLGCA